MDDSKKFNDTGKLVRTFLTIIKLNDKLKYNYTKYINTKKIDRFRVENRSLFRIL